MNNDFLHTTKAGTVGGTLLVVILQLSSGELMKTALLAAIGAGVSVIVSLLLKYIIRRFTRK